MGAAAGDGAAAAVVSCAASAGQVPLIATCTSAPAGFPSATITAGSVAGLSLRCGESGTRASQVPPCHCATGLAALSITPGVSGRNVSVRPCHAAGRPATRTAIAPSRSSAVAWAPGTLCGAAACAAAKSAAWAAVAARAGSCSTKSPDSGMHTSLQTSHSACSLTSSVSALKPAGTVTGTGSSSEPS